MVAGTEYGRLARSAAPTGAGCRRRSDRAGLVGSSSRTFGLAPAVVEELFEAFDKLRREISILIVDHHLDLALALSDRTVALERGQVAYMGPSKALSEDLDLRRKVLWL